MTRGSVVAESVAALRAVSGLAPSPDILTRLANDVEAEWIRAPWTLGIRGAKLGDRTALLDFLAGGDLLGARAAGCPAIRLRRGERTSFVAVGERGPGERHV